MAKISKNKNLARKLDINVRSLELRMQLLAPLVGDVTRPEYSRLTVFERAEAELLGLLTTPTKRAK